MPQRDSCASALAPRLSPEAWGLLKTQAASVPNHASGQFASKLAAIHMYGCVFAVPSAAFFGAPRGASARFL